MRDGNLQLTLRERHNLATYIGLQLTRVPGFHQAASVAEKNKLEEFLKQLVTDDRSLEKRINRYRSIVKDPANNLTPESVKKAVLEERIKIVRSADAKEHFTAFGVWAGFEIAAIIFSMKWTLFQNKTDNKFFASDNPVALLTPDANPPKKWDDSVEIALPISPRQMLSIHSRLQSLQPISLLDPKVPEYIGACILPTVHRFVFCSSNEQGQKLLNLWLSQADRNRPEM